MFASQLLSRPNRIALAVLLSASLGMHTAILILRFYMTITRWDVAHRYRRDRPAIIYQIIAIVLDTALLPVLGWEVWTLIKRRLTYAAFLLYSIGWFVYWGVMIGVVVAAMSNVSEGASYGMVWYVMFMAALFGLYTAQMFWSIGVFVHDKKARKRAETIPGGAAADISLKNMSAEYERAGEDSMPC